MSKRVIVVGAGLAGCETARFLADKGVEVILLESKVLAPNPAQKIKDCAELVCTNSLKSMNPASGHGLLKYEMNHFNSLVLQVAHETKVPAGDALAVDRENFSRRITEVLKTHTNITFIDEVVENPIKVIEKYQADLMVLATGPLTNPELEKWILEYVSEDDFYFYDAIAPVVDSDSLDYSKLYFKDRHKEADDTADYLNAPMNQEQYELFVKELVAAEKVPAKDFEEYKFFEACLPIDIMAERGIDTPRFSCMKPIGLENEGEQPYAVVQLRKENLLGSAFNLVGFQTRLKYPEQKRVFRMIPGFEKAEFIHLGSVHRNSFLNSRQLLNRDFSLKKDPKFFFAGQITGVEGYTESASMGIYVGLQVWRKLNDQESIRFPVETGMGALVNYVMTSERAAPSSINFGLLPTIALTKEQRKVKRRKSLKKELVSARAREVFDQFSSDNKL